MIKIFTLRTYLPKGNPMPDSTSLNPLFKENSQSLEFGDFIYVNDPDNNQLIKAVFIEYNDVVSPGVRKKIIRAVPSLNLGTRQTSINDYDNWISLR